MLAKYNLENNNWLQKQFELREKWALVYGRQTFCADMSTTQRSESMNNQIKMYIGYNYDLLRFFHHFERLLADRRYEELKADFKNNQSKPSLPYPVEVLKHAADVYTLTVFKYFSKEIWLTWDSARAAMSEQSFDIAMSDGENTLSKVETTLKQLSIEDSLNMCTKNKIPQADETEQIENNGKKVKGVKCKPRRKGDRSSNRPKNALEKATRKRKRQGEQSVKSVREKEGIVDSDVSNSHGQLISQYKQNMMLDIVYDSSEPTYQYEDQWVNFPILSMHGQLDRQYSRKLTHNFSSRQWSKRRGMQRVLNMERNL
ncbi:hypothetical protein V6N12_008142 [Hibiscus sabdariffa]|uniref:Protein FAR1-RELATED SEQUENCE n=1 Tax=Hibiscus sabdariffa TaxID=183260 RepID=A0ABR2BT10_9ROSI